ncbi:hypothetical protein [Streptomyces sp. CB00316]|uniref:hypothetical protein n=1 Tax=Streptomyces sp. CB00316 TaxID=1703932 RepID=UPI003B6415BB
MVASLCAAYAATLVFAVLGGNSTAPWLLLSGPQEEAKAEEAEVLPAPTAPVWSPPPRRALPPSHRSLRWKKRAPSN